MDKDPLDPMKNMWDQDEESRKMLELTMPAIRENYYKFDGTAERTNTRENGILDLRGIRKEHGQTDEYSDTYRIKQSTQAVLDEEKQKVGRKKIDQEWD